MATDRTPLVYGDLKYYHSLLMEYLKDNYADLKGVYSKADIDKALEEIESGGITEWQGGAGQNMTPNGHTGYVTVDNKGTLGIYIPAGFDGRSGGSFANFSYPVKY